MPWLLHAGSRIQVAEGETVVGAGERADARVSGSGLSPRHFVIALDRGRATVRASDVESVVTLNGDQLDAEPCPLSHGDTIAAGSGWFVYLEREDAAAAARPPRPSKLAAAAEAWLVDEAAGLAWPLMDPLVGIGRDPSNTVPLSASTASRFHAQVRREAGGLVLHAGGSAGTWLNGTRVATPMLLAAGDDIQVGGAHLRVVAGALPPGVTPAGAASASDATRRPTIQRMTPMSAEATSLKANSRVGLVGVLVVVVAVVVWLVMR